MGIAAAAVLFAEGYRRTLVISPPHLVYKWRREILETIADARFWVLNGPDTLRQLLKIRATQETQPDAPEFYIIGRVRMRMGFDWRPAIARRKIHERNITNESDSASRRTFVVTHEYAACPDCGQFILDEEGERIAVAAFMQLEESRKICRLCQAPLWTLKRHKPAADFQSLVHQAIVRFRPSARKPPTSCWRDLARKRCRGCCPTICSNSSI